MQWILVFLCSIFSQPYLQSFENLPYLNFNDLRDSSTFLVYIYYDRLNIECPLCKKFNEKISELQVPIKKLNFYADPYITSHFYVYEFPSFIVRYNLRSYYIKADTIDKLFEIIENEKWKTQKPFSSFCNLDTYLTKVHAILYTCFYYSIEYSADYIESIPAWAVNGVMTFIISYLVISIVSTFRK